MKKFPLLLFILLMKQVNAQLPELVSDLTNSSASSSPASFELLDGKLFFAATVWNSSTPDRELYVTDGTTNGTTLFLDILPNMSSSPEKLIAYDNRIYFIVSDSSNGVLVHRPYVTDGTVSGTFLLLPNPTTTLGYTIEFDEKTSPENIFVYNKGFVYFRARKDNNANDFAIFKTDGSPAGTIIAASLQNTTGITNLMEGPLVYKDSIYFSGTSNGSTQSTLYKSKGTINSITVVQQGITLVPEYGSIVYDDKLFFCGYANNGPELWLTDGTSSGTVELADLRTDSGLGSWPGSFNRINDAIVFLANSTGNAVELYAIDSTTASLLPSNISTIAYSPLDYRSDYMTRYSGKLFFCGQDFINGSELWSTNGTVSGTGLLVDINPGPQSSDPATFTRYCGKLYFSAYNPSTNYSNALYETDGSSFGTTAVPGTIANPNGCRNVFDKIIYKGKLFYNGKYDGMIGNELYNFDAGCTTSIVETSENGSIICYPNPGVQEINIVSADRKISSVTMYDVNGKQVFYEEVIDEGTARLNANHFLSGIYMIKVQTGNSFSF